VALLVSLLLAGAITHQAVPCVPVDRYARVTAEAPAAARAELQFRTLPGGPWYSAGMTREGAAWIAFLPRPTSAGHHLEYRVVATAADATTAMTEPAVIRVVATPAECDAESSPSVATPIVVTVPEGAPLVPPVPAGLSPAGVTAAAERPRSKTALKIAGGAAVVAIVAATALGTAEASQDPDDEPFRVPTLTFNGTDPRPGSTIFFAVHEPIVSLLMDHQPAQVVTLVWTVEYVGAPGVCVRQGGVMQAQRQLELVLQSPLRPTGACGASFDVSSLRVAVDYQGATIFDQTLSLPFRFEP